MIKPEYFKTIFQTEPPASGFPCSFAIVTGCNPDGITVSAERNGFLTRELQLELEKAKARYWSVRGCSPDLRHCEAGFAVEVDLRIAVALGRKFQQEAIYWIRNGQLFVVDCRSGQEVFVDDWSARTLGPGDLLDHLAVIKARAKSAGGKRYSTAQVKRTLDT
jgi:hypothetical protein